MHGRDTLEEIKAAERARIAACLRRYFEEGTGTCRVLLEYLELDYVTGIHEGWLDLNNAISDHNDKVAAGERLP